MNKDNARDYLPLVQALADGKPLQVKTVNGWDDIQSGVSFCYAPEKYRIKPEPKEVWFNQYEHDVTRGPYVSKEEAENYAGNFAKQVRYREVIE